MDALNLNAMMETGEQTSASGVQRDIPEIEEGERTSVAKWQKKILAAKKFFEKDFKRMREDMKIAKQGGSDEWVNNGNYTVPIIGRHINQSVSSLYAKNPTAVVEKRKTLDYTLWDGKPETAIAALQGFLQGDVSQLPLVQDIEQGRQRHEMLMKISKTLEVLFDYYANEQKPRLKPLMKSMVRRARTCGVGYLMLGFQREYGELTPDETAELVDARNKLAEMQHRTSDFIDGEVDPATSEEEEFELKTLIADMEDKQNRILREGPKFMFPRATEIIVDPRCTQLMGFIGAGWVVREFHKTPDEVQKIYHVDLKKSYTPYRENGKGEMADYHRSAESEDKGEDGKCGMVCIWEAYNKDLEQTFTICDGYPGYLIKPKEPDYYMEGFWPIFAVTFNDVEQEEGLYPFSDPHQLKHVQAEYNRSREYRRLHREANKPKYATVKGRLTDADKEKLSSAPAHAVIEFESLGQGEKIGDLVQRFESVPIDPALYETNSEMEDILRTVGGQEANIGGVSGASATETSIAEGGRMTSLQSNVDDLDEFLTDVFSALGQLLIMELSSETVKEIAGVGAVWPEMDRESVIKQLNLKVRAGSSGRPNKAAELANMERGMPYMIQLPGVNPYPLARRYADLLEINLEDFVVEGMPSIQAMNAQLGRATQGQGGPNDPNAQGNEGVTNQTSTQTNEPGAQPAYPTGTEIQFDEQGNML